MGFSNLLCYRSKGGHICTRPEVEGKCALPRGDNIADMKNLCDNMSRNVNIYVVTFHIKLMLRQQFKKLCNALFTIKYINPVICHAIVISDTQTGQIKRFTCEIQYFYGQ